MRWRRNGAADRAELRLELLAAFQREREVVVLGHEGVALCGALLEFLVVQFVARANRLRALHRDALKVVRVVRALEIWLAPRRFRNFVTAKRGYATLRCDDARRVDFAL